MMASSTDQTNTAQLKELEFELAWKTRDEIISNLIEHTNQLSGLTIESDARKATQKANARLLARLMNLPVKGDGRSRSSESLDQSSEVVFELDSDVRCRIVDTLMTNHNVVMLEADSAASELKSKLIVRNNKLIGELVKLKSRTVAVPSDSSTSNGDQLIEQTAKASESQTTNKTPTRTSQRLKKDKRNVDATSQPVEQSVTVQSTSSPIVEKVKDILKEELRKISGELSKQISDQSSVIGSLEENVRGLKRKLDESNEVENEATVILNESKAIENEVTVPMELKGVEAVLAGSKKEVRSQIFTFGGISWYLLAKLFVSETEYLEVSLAYNRTVEQVRWSAVITSEVRLLSSDSGAVCHDVIKTSKNLEFMNPDEFDGRSWREFITIDKLRSGSFIQEDAIKLRAHLTIKSLETFTD